ncbi:MAG: TIGR03936 family radical SAM-associated protein [Acidimicrobiales bacterium]
MIVRVRFSKLGRIRWTSHRDVARLWERSLRRARLAVSYTGGFSPRPNLSFGLALPTGCESVAEYLDVRLDSEIEPEELRRSVETTLPDGIEVLATGTPDSTMGSVQEDVTSCSWEISVPGADREALQRAVAETMGAQSLPVQRERKGRQVSDDLRPSLLALLVVDHEEDRATPQTYDTAGDVGSKLIAELGTRPRGVRPAELARAMGVEFGVTRRTHQWIEREDSRFEPLELRAAVPAGANASAS